MTLIRIATLLALGGLAAAAWRRRNRGEEAPAQDAADGAPDAAEAAIDSPNDAERLQTRGFAETTAEAFDGDLFGSNSQQGAEPKVPGLPDFARGA